MKLAIDVMGFENNIDEAIKASRDFIKKHKDVSLVLVGNDQIIKDKMFPTDKFSVAPASQVVLPTDSLLVARRKIDSSMVVAAKLVKDGKVDGFLSAGSTSAFVSTVYSVFGLIKNVDKPGFMPWVPSTDGVGFNLLDVGASPICTPKDLHNFAKMAKIYVEKARHIDNPRIAILNIGTEEYKGLDLHREANKLLKEDKSLNYIGFVESRRIMNGIVDIVVTDGYSGNLVLKACEGTGKALMHTIKDAYKKPINYLGALFSLGMIRKMKHTFDYKNHSGAFVLGLNYVAVKTHGSADARQFYSSLQMLYDCVDANVLNDIKTEMETNNG